MLTTLTTEQEALIPVVRDEWLNRVLRCETPLNREAATEAVHWLYEFSGLEKPMVICVESPFAAQLAANLLKQLGAGAQVWAQVWEQVGDQVREQVWEQVWEQVGDQVREQVWEQVGAQVREQVRTQVWDQVRDQVRTQVWDQVAEQVWAQVWARVGDQVWAQVREQVRTQVWAQVRTQVWEQKLEFFSFSSYGNVGDHGWMSFYEFFSRIGVFQHKGFDRLKVLLDAGIYDMIQLKGVCIVCGMPSEVARDDRGRLHRENGPAIKWGDGWELFFWHGLAVTEQLIMQPETLSREDITTQRNAEYRRAIMEKIGPQAYAELLGIEEVDRDESHGQTVRLLRTREADEIIGDHLQFVHVQCTSTSRDYYLPVPPNISNAWEALSFTFPNRAHRQYAPTVET